MSTEKNPEMDNSKDKGNDFEIIDEKDMEMVRRGRPSSIDEKIVELLKKVPVGKGGVFNQLSVDWTAYNNEKNAEKKAELLKEIISAKQNNSAKIRNSAHAAGWKKVSIKWSVNGSPFAKRTA
jgi:hypothetical protein